MKAPLSIGTKVTVVDDVAGPVEGVVTGYHRDGSPLATFNGSPPVVLHEGLYDVAGATKSTAKFTKSNTRPVCLCDLRPGMIVVNLDTQTFRRVLSRPQDTRRSGYTYVKTTGEPVNGFGFNQVHVAY